VKISVVLKSRKVHTLLSKGTFTHEKCLAIFLPYDVLNHRTGLHHPLEAAAVGRLAYGRCRMSSRMKAKTSLYILLLDAT
jgi:hypothetical protein